MEKSVSLLIMTQLSLEPGGAKELVAVLQRRGERNHENGFLPETWPGACQLTVHGKLEENETFKEALWRETKQEVGEDFVGCSYNDWKDNIAAKMTEIGQVNKPNKIIGHYAIEVPYARLQLIKLNPSTGGLRFIRQKEVDKIFNLLQHTNKNYGVTSRLEVAMFPDEIEALKTAFAHFGKTP